MPRAIVALAAMLAAGGAVHAQTVGQQVYSANCAVCHQAEGQGAAGLAPPLKGGYWPKLAGARQYVPGVLLAGMHGAVSTDEGVFVGVMPPQNRLSDEQIAAASNYLIAELNGHAASQALDAQEVALLRAKALTVAQLRLLRKQALAP